MRPGNISSLLLMLICCFFRTSEAYKLRCVDGFPCDGIRCIDLSSRCDGRYDCIDRTDEAHCDPCRIDQAQCHNGACIARSKLCNQIKDCQTGEDEDPEYCVTHKCPGEFLCRLTMAECVREPCTERSLCSDYTDQAEEVCSVHSQTKNLSVICADSEFSCRNKIQCVHRVYRCDGYPDCDDGSDEDSCAVHPVSLWKSDEFICSNGLSVPKDWVCDQKADCPDGEDEQLGPSTMSNCTIHINENQSISSDISCPTGMMACGTTSTMVKPGCIPLEKQCDGVYDCPDHIDELDGCAQHCEQTGGFTCRTSSAQRSPALGPLCISREAVCDGVIDCPNGDDESEGPRAGCTPQKCKRDNGGCSQLCKMVGGRAKCSCLPGYVPPPNNPRSCVAIGDIHLLFIENGRLYRRNLRDTSDMEFELKPHMDTSATSNNLPSLQGVWTTRKEIHIPWRPVIADFDYSLNLNSHLSDRVNLVLAYTCMWSGLLTAIPTEVSSPTSSPKLHSVRPLLLPSGWVHSNPSELTPYPIALSYDWVHGLVYWTNSTSNTIEVIDHEKGWHKTLIQLPLNNQPVAITVDPRFGRLYWVERGKHPSIQTSDMDGKNRKALVSAAMISPTGLTIDFAQNELYWVDGDGGTIEAYGLRTHKRRIVLQSADYHPVWMAVFEDWIYWTDRNFNCLLRANKHNGGQVQHLLNISNPLSFRIQHELLRPAWVNRCQLTSCEQLCLPVPLHSYPNHSTPFVCACANGWIVDPRDHNRCTWIANSTHVQNSVTEAKILWNKMAKFFSILIGSPKRAAVETTLPRENGAPHHFVFLVTVFGASLLGLSISCIGHYMYQRHFGRRRTGSDYTDVRTNKTRRTKETHELSQHLPTSNGIEATQQLMHHSAKPAVCDVTSPSVNTVPGVVCVTRVVPDQDTCYEF